MPVGFSLFYAVGFSLKVYMIAEDRERRAVDAAAELVDFRDVDRDDFDAGCFEIFDGSCAACGEEHLAGL